MNQQPKVPPILDRSAFATCHIVLPDEPRPVGAIAYAGSFYSYVKVFQDPEAAQRGADRLMQRNNQVVLTRTRKGLVLWVLEPDAKAVS